MASVIVYPADLSAPVLVPLTRKVVHLGAASDNDVVLSDGDASGHHAHITYDKSGFVLNLTDDDATMTVNGKRRKSHKLADQDVFRLGEHLVRFVLYDQGLSTPSPTEDTVDSRRFNALHRFSSALMDTYTVPELLETLLDELIALADAQKAFLLLTTDGAPRIQVARNIDRQSLEEPNMAVSDSIVQQVLEEGRSLILADALSDQAFKNSRSVIDLKLCSVMCVPLRARGSTLGLFYLGNDNAVNHFTPALMSSVDVFAAQAALILDNALSRQELESHVKELEQEVSDRRFGEIIGACDAMCDIFDKIGRVATTDISVLIEGETGTGKELVAHAIHARSNRTDKPFVVINCGAIPENLLESELFGHVKGAFTGAVATTEGKFQAANRGTLFLDEIGEMPLSLQVKILRAIQDKSVMKVGGHREEKVDIRIVCATNRRLAEEVHEGRFREDLFYRLNVISLRLPPLRERGEDVVLLARYFLKRYGGELAGRAVSLSNEAVKAIRRWGWPGNIRELENRLKKAVVFSDSGIVSPDDMDLGADSLEPVLPLNDARERWQKEYLNRVLAMNGGNRTQTARMLEVDPRTIFRHLERERDEG